MINNGMWMFRILLGANLSRKSCSSRGSFCCRYLSLEMWFSWLLFSLVWRKIKAMMYISCIVYCGTEIMYCVVFQASLNQAVWHWNSCKKLPAKNKSRSFHFKCVRFSSRFCFWRFLADSWGKGTNAFGAVDGTRDSRALLQFYLSPDGGFLFVKPYACLMPWCSYLKPPRVSAVS